jgi:hypothetical protein
MLRAVACVTQLVYHPAFDPYNALLRTVRVLDAANDGLDADALRILEFYLLFPEEMMKARLNAKLRSAVKRLGAEPRFPYDRLPAPRSVFDRMAGSFDGALQTMAARGLVVVDENTQHVQLIADAMPKELLDLAREQNENESQLMSILVAMAAEFPTAGPNGLKDRTGLAEYRYDAV